MSVVRRYGLLLIIVLVVGGLAFVFRDRISGNASELKVGDCFDAPTLESQTVTDVQHHPCTEAHSGEVFAVLTNPAAGSAPYPDRSGRLTFAGDQCAGPFLAYVGKSMDTTALEVAFFGPTPDGWAKGDRVFTCYVETNPPATTSAKGSNK